ncbi:MAG: MFS transporter [Pseudomonadota bacterium]
MKNSNANVAYPPPAYPPPVRTVAALGSLYMARMLGLFMVLPVLTLAGAEYLGSNIFLLGVALGIYGLTQALLQIPFGILSDRYGRKPLIAIGMAIFALGSVVAAAADSVQGLIVGRALQGAGAIAGVVMAMVADLTRDQHRTKAMAAIGASIGIAFALSLVLGPVLTALGGVRLIFWLSLALSIIGLLVLIFLVPSSAKDSARALNLKQGIRIVVQDLNLLKLNLGIFVLHGVLMALFVVLPTLLLAVDIPAVQHAWVYLGVMAVSFLLIVPFIIIGEQRRKLKSIFLLMVLLAALALAALPLAANSLEALIGATLLFFISFNYLEASLPALMSKTINAKYRGAGSGLFATFQFTGAALGGILGGWAYQQWGLATLLWGCALAVLMWLLLSISMTVPAPGSENPTKNVIA